MVLSRQIGARVKRKEDPRLITGSSTYVDDLRPARTAHLMILRSIYGHARIVRVDASAAQALPGVIAAYTGEEFRALCGPLPGREGEAVPGMTRFVAPTAWPIATDPVRFVGEPVAIVVAADRYIARDALDLIDVEYDPLPAVVDAEAALAPDAPQLYDEAQGNVAYVWRHTNGDADAAFAAAHIIVEQR